MRFGRIKDLTEEYNGIMEQVEIVPTDIRKDVESVFSDTRLLERLRTPVEVFKIDPLVLDIRNNDTDYVRLIFIGGKRVKFRYALHTPENPATGNGTLLLLPGHRMVIANLLSAMYSWDGKS